MKTKNINKKFLSALMAMGFMAPYVGLALGTDSKDLLLPCSGKITVAGVGAKHLVPEREGRAGPLPAFAYVYLDLKVTEVAAECGELEKKLEKNLMDLKFSTSKSYKHLTDAVLLEKLAQAEVGKVYPFKTEQYFHYMEANGYLPFYPLLSTQTVGLKSEIAIGPNFEVKPVKSYLIEEEKVELSQAIFSKLKENEYKENSFNNNLHSVLTEMHPNFEENFKVFLKELLHVYAQYENKAVGNPSLSFSTNFHLLSLAQGISKLTHKYPQYYAFDIPVLLSEHASLLQLSHLPNMTAIDLEEALELLEQDLKANKVSEALKLGFHGVLKNIAGHYLPGSAVVALSSQKSKDLAKDLLLTYYSL